MKTTAKIALGIILLSVFPRYIRAQQMPDPVRFTVTQAPEQIKAGQEFRLRLNAKISGDWHLYSVHNDPDAGPFPTRFSPVTENLHITGPIQESTPVKEYDPNFKAELGWHQNKATFAIPLAFGKAISGQTKATLKVVYQVCTDQVCLPPKTKEIGQSITVSGVSAKPLPKYEDSSNHSSVAAGNDLNGQQITPVHKSGIGGSGFFSFIWIAITAGFAALITPCVYPMIPLTVSYFSKERSNDSPSGFLPALGFGMAIIALFTILGVLLSVFIGVAGANQFAASPWVNLFIALVLIAFALSLLGAFDIRLPYQFTNWLNRESNERSGWIGILFMALTISAVSFSCTAPFVGGVLAATAGGQWFYPVMGMLFFSAAFASPFVLLALFPGWMESLPKSGSWMNIIKVLLGFIELAAAFKFLSNADLVWEWGLISRPFTIAAWIAIFLLAGLYILGVFTLHHQEKTKGIGTGRVLLSVPFLLFSFYLIPGLLGASMGIWDAWLPPKRATDISVVSSISQNPLSTNHTQGTPAWSGDYQQSVKHAAEVNRPVFIDFTGYTCTNCRAMETNVFPRATIQQSFKKMELVRLFTDDGTDGPRNQKFQFKLTGTVALPTYVIVDPHTHKVINQLEGYTGKEDFQHFLDEGLALFRQENSTI